MLAIGLLTCCATGARGSVTALRLSHASAAHEPSEPTRLLVRRQDRALRPAAASPGYLVWGSGGIESESVTTALVQRDLHSKATRVLAPATRPDFGVASTAKWVVYVTGEGSLTVVAVSHDGTRRHVLGNGLIAPVASRGERVAWAQEHAGVQRVFVQNMATGRKWLAARLPRCVAGRCYRIDFVTLADRGVVFSRGAIGPQPSLIVRRAYIDAKPTTVPVPNDPQPDLAPSSEGALYYAYSRGWYRWDFGRRLPRLTQFKGPDQAPILRYERGDWYLRGGKSCRPSVRVLSPKGPQVVISSPGGKTGLARTPASDCAEMTDLVLTHTDVITAWVFRPPYAITAHNDFGLVGVLLATKHRRS